MSGVETIIIRRLGMMKKSDKKSIAWIIGIIAFAFIVLSGGLCRAAVPVSAATVTPTPTPVPEKYLVAVSAYYTGGAVIVGEKIDTGKIVAYAYYSDGTYVKVTDYTISDKVVSKSGVNKMALVYKGYTATFNVTGKAMVRITATLSRTKYSVGNMISPKEITVKAVYADNTTSIISEGYGFSIDEFTVPGTQKVTIDYRDFETSVTVNVSAAKAITNLTVYYSGGTLITDEEIDRNKLTVTAIYADRSSERINTYKLATTSFDKTGTQTITVSYRGMKATVSVNVLERRALSMRAEYKGEDIVVGKEFNPKDLHVYVMFNNHKEEQVEDFTVYSRKIKYVGANTVRVYYDALSATVLITGTEVMEPNFDYVSVFNITNGSSKGTVTTAIPSYLPEDAVTGRSLKLSVLEKVYNKLEIEDGEYIGFTYGFTEEDYELELPLTIRIKLPRHFDVEYTELYYTPNRKTIVGKMNKEIVDDNVMEVMIFKTGTYMLVYAPYSEDEELEAEEEDEYLD